LGIPDTIFEAPQPPIPANENAKFRAQLGTISRHSTVFFAGAMFTAAAGYLFKIYVARVLGAEALGVYALGLTIVGILGIFIAPPDNGICCMHSFVEFRFGCSLPIARWPSGSLSSGLGLQTASTMRPPLFRTYHFLLFYWRWEG
jgi:hypothetical protein